MFANHMLQQSTPVKQRWKTHELVLDKSSKNQTKARPRPELD